LLVLYVHAMLVGIAVQKLPSDLIIVRWSAEALLLPYASYCVLAAMWLLYWDIPNLDQHHQ
jgi:hypothetical protein